jgi:hypothetical protein
MYYEKWKNYGMISRKRANSRLAQLLNSNCIMDFFFFL